MGLENNTVHKMGASLGDKIMMMGLARDKTEREMMTTENDVLCYKYDLYF